MLVLNIGPVLSARGIERPFSFLVNPIWRQCSVLSGHWCL
jgi:hypothetical protein